MYLLLRNTWIVFLLKLRIAFRTPTVDLIACYFILYGLFTVAAMQRAKQDVFRPILGEGGTTAPEHLNETVLLKSASSRKANFFRTSRYVSPLGLILSITR